MLVAELGPGVPEARGVSGRDAGRDGVGVPAPNGPPAPLSTIGCITPFESMDNRTPALKGVGLWPKPPGNGEPTGEHPVLRGGPTTPTGL